MFSLHFGGSRQSTGATRYCGDCETGLVHRNDADCAAEASEPFLDVRTALVRGYTPCPCCVVAQGAARLSERGAHLAYAN
jgi:hypothetical protein